MITNNSFKIQYTLGFIALLAGAGMFTYDNFISDEIKAKTTTTVYVAKDEIPAHTQITKDMFNAVTIPKNGIVGKSIQNLKDVIGDYTVHGLKAGELLMEQQLSEDALNSEGDLLIPVEGVYVSDITPTDTVGIYVVYTEKDGATTIKRVLKSKRVYVQSNYSAETGTDEMSYFVKVNESELQAYFEALKKGEIIIAKHLNEVELSNDVIKGETIEDFVIGGDESLDFNSDQASNEKPSSAIYTPTGKDTWESIAAKFKISVQELYDLNPDIVKIEPNIKLIVPAI